MANTKTAASPPNTYFQSPQGKWTSTPAYQAAAAGQAQKDVAALGGMANLGIANQNALGQYGASRNAALTNQSVAAANAYGQMQNSYLNTMGQLGQIGGALSAAGLAAGAQSGSSSQSSSSSQYDRSSKTGSATQYGQMGSSMGSGGGGGFSAGGPGGAIASGMTGGYGGFGGTFGGSSASQAKSSANSDAGSSSKSESRTVTGASSGERTGMLDQGYGFLKSLSDLLSSPTGQASGFAKNLGQQFDANRAGMMSPDIVNSLNANLYGGYNALSGLYGQADYGFNTSSAGRSVPRYR